MALLPEINLWPFERFFCTEEVSLKAVLMRYKELPGSGAGEHPSSGFLPQLK